MKQKKTVTEIFKEKTRNPNRIRSSDVIKNIFTDIAYFKAKDYAIISGTGYINKKKVIFIGQEKPKGNDLAYASKVNFGMVKPIGYRHVIEILEFAETNNLPVVTFVDTPGADPSSDSAKNLQSWSISDCISKFCTVKTPTVSLVLGEGGSGGALALQVTDRRLIMEDAMYYVIAPESCGSIIFRDNTKIEESLNLIRPTSKDMLYYGICDEIVKEPEDIFDYEGYVKSIKSAISKAVADVLKTDVERLLERRRRRVLSYGVYKKQGFFAQVVDFFHKDETSQVSRKSRAKIINADELSNSLERAYFESKNMDLSKPHVICEKKDGRGCGGYVPLDEYQKNYKSCPICGKAETLMSDEWTDILCDSHTFTEFNNKITAKELLNKEDLTESYLEALEAAEVKSGCGESLTTGIAKINNYRAVLAISNFNFFGGSMGSAMGEKFYRAVQFCISRKLPLIGICASGGARMQEGTVSLVQMAKTNMAVSLLKEAGLPFISIMTHPSTGGALASFATQGTINIGEKNALVCFAGPRVTQLAGIKVDPEVTISDFVYTINGVDEIITRTNVKKIVTKYLKFFYETVKAIK